MKGKIDREQKYALACKEVNAHIPKFSAGLSQWQRMYNMADLVLDRWKALPTTSESEIMTYLHIYKSYTLPSAIYPTWACKGNGLLSSVCDDTYDTPYKALEDHRIIAVVIKTRIRVLLDVVVRIIPAKIIMKRSRENMLSNIVIVILLGILVVFH